MSDHGEYGLVMPFVVCRSEGGPYDDAAFAAGATEGRLDALLEFTQPKVHEQYVPTPLIPQIDLLAMHHGYSMEAEPWDEHPDEWTYVRLTRAAEDNQDTTPADSGTDTSGGDAVAEITHWTKDDAAAPLIAAAERERIADAILNSCDHSGSFQPPGTDEAWACDECRDAASIARGEPS